MSVVEVVVLVVVVVVAGGFGIFGWQLIPTRTSTRARPAACNPRRARWRACQPLVRPYGCMNPAPTRAERAQHQANATGQLQPIDDGGGELAALDLGGAIHQPGEVVGDDLVGDGGLEGTDDVGGRIGPPEVLVHEHARQ